MTDTLTVTGHLLIPDGPTAVGLTPGTVIVQGERIAEVRLGDFHPHPDIGDEACLIFPGFVDAHLHLPQFDSMGVDGLDLIEWLNAVVFPAELKWADRDYAAEMTARVAAELHSFGTTAVAAYATSHHASSQAAIDVLAEAGFAGHVGQVLMDRGAPAGLLVPPSAALGQASTLRAKGRISPAVTPRFAVACSEQLLRGAGTLATRTGWFVQTHVAETRGECELVRELFGAESYARVYQEAGLLTARTLLGHGIWLDDSELRLLRETDTVIAHCPTANRFLSSGTLSRARAKTAGVRVCLGTDIGAGPDRSMVRVARGMIEAAKQVTGGDPGTIPSAAECLWQITEGNASALGLSDTGTLARGRLADLLIVKPTVRWQGSPDPLSMLLYSWDDRWLIRTLAGGRVVYSA